MYGLHTNAETGFLTNQGVNLFRTISEIAGGGGGGGGGGLEGAREFMNAYMAQLPPNLDMIEIRGRVTDKNPFVIVSLQESDRMNILLSTLRGSMIELELGISGALNVTEKMEKLAGDLQVNKVTAVWLGVAYPSLKTLSNWFADLLTRVQQLLDWTTELKLLKSI